MPETITNEDMNRLVIQFVRQHHLRMHTLMDEIGLYRGQPPLLHILWEYEGCTQTELAEALHLAGATVTKMLQRLEEAGFVERRPDAEDQRVSRVYLTEAGRQVKQSVLERERQVGKEMLAGITPEERTVTAYVLKRMRDNLQAINRIPGGHEPRPFAHRRKHHRRTP